MTLTLDAISIAGLLAAMALIGLSLLGWWQERSMTMARLFALLALIGSWWTATQALAFTDLSLRYPPFFLASQIASGFFGPLLLLFTLAYLGRLPRLRWWCALVLMPGAFGTLNVLLTTWFVPEDVRRTSLVDFLAGAPVTALPLVARAPWFLPLQFLHMIQLYACMLLGAGLFTWHAHRTPPPIQAADARILALIYGLALVALTLTEFMPLSGFRNAPQRLAPLLSLPFLLVVRQFMQRRVIEVRTLRAEREALLPFLPVREVREMLRPMPMSAVPTINAAVLFTDLRSFTTLSERLDPGVLIRWLDEFFQRMSDVILLESGMVDKLMGDGILAVFGGPAATEHPCGAALRAALGMQRALEELNCTQPIEATVTLRMGIGIHYGHLAVGTLGGHARKTYTVIGDTVNTAQRIEAQTKATHYPILVSRAVFDELDASDQTSLQPLGPVQLPGKQQLIELYGWAGRRPGLHPPR